MKSGILLKSGETVGSSRDSQSLPMLLAVKNLAVQDDGKRIDNKHDDILSPAYCPNITLLQQ